MLSFGPLFFSFFSFFIFHIYLFLNLLLKSKTQHISRQNKGISLAKNVMFLIMFPRQPVLLFSCVGVIVVVCFSLMKIGFVD